MLQGAPFRGCQACLHSALALLERGSTLLRNSALIANPPESLSITVLFIGALNRKCVGSDIATAEYAWPVGMPLSKSLGNGLFEIRTNISNGRNSRIIFAVVGNEMVLLHSFIKKAQKTPKSDLDLALKRLKEVI